MDVQLISPEKQLVRRLLDQKLIDDAQVERARSVSVTDKLSLDRAILKLGFVDEEALLENLAAVLEQRFANQSHGLLLDEEKLERLGRPYCRGVNVAPVTDAGGGRYLLISDPTNSALLEELAFHLDEPVEVSVATSRSIRRMLSEGGAPEQVSSRERQQQDQEAVRAADADGPVIRFVSETIHEAVALGASDIHFESQESGLRIRFRINGLLHPQPVDHALNASSILARVKVMAQMNVSERRLPQDGRITSTIAGRRVDFRVSSVPTAYGESIVCRVLDPKALKLGWEKLGFDAELTRQITTIIEQPSGMFVVTGPTGSGKTTTLYTALAHLNQEGRKILTVEDPIEYNLPGIEQVQVHEEIGLSFASVLRSFLRQDPNIIMVGEIRDQETAEIACRAALVGRMVLTTLHTNTPEGAVTRLMDLGVPDYIVRDVLRGVLGQQLEMTGGKVRRLVARLVE